MRLKGDRTESEMKLCQKDGKSFNSSAQSLLESWPQNQCTLMKSC